MKRSTKLVLNDNELLQYLTGQVMAKMLIQDQLDEEIKRLSIRISKLKVCLCSAK